MLYFLYHLLEDCCSELNESFFEVSLFLDMKSGGFMPIAEILAETLEQNSIESEEGVTAWDLPCALFFTFLEWFLVESDDVGLY